MSGFDKFTKQIGSFLPFLNDQMEVLRRHLDNPFVLSKGNILGVVEEFEIGIDLLKERLKQDRDEFTKRIAQKKYRNVRQANTSMLSPFEKQIEKGFLDAIRGNMPLTARKRNQRRIIEVAWAYSLSLDNVERTLHALTEYRSVVKDFPDSPSDHSFPTKLRTLMASTHRIDRATHRLYDSLTVYCILTRRILSRLGYKVFIPVKIFLQKSADEYLDYAWEQYIESNFGVVLALVRISLEYAFLNKLEYVAIAKARKLGWMETPRLRHVLKGCSKIGISLPVKKETVGDIYIACSRVMHTGYREETHRIYNVLRFVRLFVKEFMKQKVTQEKKDELVEWLDLYGRIRKIQSR